MKQGAIFLSKKANSLSGQDGSITTLWQERGYEFTTSIVTLPLLVLKQVAWQM
jgi:hypothetical protein